MSCASTGPWWTPYRSASGIRITHVDLKPDPIREAEALTRLDRNEQAQWKKYFPGPRRRFALCRAALRSILCSRLGCSNEELSFGASGHGKPVALVMGAQADVSFNVSHSGEHGLIAVADNGERLGIDLEERVAKRNLQALIEAVMGPDEQALLASLQGSEKLRLFYRIWTCKEALVKALGTGFTTDVSQFQISPDSGEADHAHTFTFPHLPSVSWALKDMSNERFAAALAYELPSLAPSPGPLESQPQDRA